MKSRNKKAMQIAMNQSYNYLLIIKANPQNLNQA